LGLECGIPLVCVSVCVCVCVCFVCVFECVCVCECGISIRMYVCMFVSSIYICVCPGGKTAVTHTQTLPNYSTWAEYSRQPEPLLSNTCSHTHTLIHTWQSCA